MSSSRRVHVGVAVLLAALLGLPWCGSVPDAAAQDPVVSAADPTEAPQGTLNLDITVSGANFKAKATTKFYVAGTTNPGGIVVRSTTVKGPSKLLVNIDVTDAALAGKFDIEVKNADGRTGKGTELFSVTAKKADACSAADPVPTGGYCFSGVPGLPGCLDTNFGYGSGRVIGPQSMLIGYGGGRSTTIDSAGRIVAVGYWHDTCQSNSTFEMAVARSLPDGAPDGAFGPNGNGVVRLAFAGGAFAHSVLVLPDNRIIVVGRAKQTRSSNILPVAVRLTESGALDATFGSGGAVFVSPGGKSSSGIFYSAARQPDGRIVAAGVGNGTGLVARLNTNGTLDTTFNGSGRYLWTASAQFNAVTIQRVDSSDRIVAAGRTRDSVGHWIGTLWRFSGSGALDSGFGEAGVVRTSLHTEDGVHYFENDFEDVVIDASNRIVTAGDSLMATPPDTASYSQVALTRYDINGTLDPSFGTGGVVVAPSEQEKNLGGAIAVQGDGRILVAGYSANNAADGGFPTNPTAGLWRFTADGAVDGSFGAGGGVADPIAAGSRAVYWTSLALQADGRIVCGGYAIIEGDPIVTYATLARFWQ